MPGEELLRDKVMSYLTGLSPAARGMLLRRLEAAPAGDLDGELRIILEAARSLSRPAASNAPVDFKERFFRPYQPFLIDELLEPKQRGWVRRASLETIWVHVVRDLMPEAFKPWLEGKGRPGVDPDVEAARLRTAALAVLARIDRETADDHKAQQRFRVLIGGETAHADLRDLIDLGERLPALERLLARLPATATPGDPSEKIFCEQTAAFALDRPDDAVFAAAAACLRLPTAGMLARIAAAAARSEDVVDIRRSPGAVFVDVILSACERSVARFRTLRSEPGASGGLAPEIRRFHDIVRLATTTLKLDDDGAWRRRLAEARRSFSELIAKELDGAVPTVRRALRVDARERPTATDGTEAVRAVAIYAAAKRARDSLAVNELVARVGPTLEQAVEVYGRELIEQMRKQRGPAKDELHGATEFLLQMAELCHGEEYAGLLRKSRDNAWGKANGTSIAV